MALTGRLLKIANAVRNMFNDRNGEFLDASDAGDAKIVLWLNGIKDELSVEGYFRKADTLSVSTGSVALLTAITDDDLTRALAVFNSDHYELRPLASYHDIEDRLLYASSGDPVYYYIQDNTLYVAPVPTAAVTLTILYSYIPPDIAAAPATVLEWSGATAYEIGDLVHYGSPVHYFEAILDGTNHATTDTDYWEDLGTTNPSVQIDPPWPLAFDLSLGRDGCLKEAFALDHTRKNWYKLVELYTAKYEDRKADLITQGMTPALVRVPERP